MTLLLTNDDGYDAPGFQALLNRLKKKHSVFVVAPMKQKSGASHSISLFQPIEYNKLNSHSYIIDGTPVDCVKVALFGFFRDISFDLLVSGLNNGPNMGDDIFYSGTVAAAREGALNKIPSLACSVDGYDSLQDFNSAALYISRLLPILEQHTLPRDQILNINLPSTPPYKQTQMTHLGKRIYSDKILFEDSDPPKLIISGDMPTHIEEPKSDLSAVNDGFISITPLSNETPHPNLSSTLEKSTIHLL